MKRILRTTTLLIAVTSLTGCGQILSLPGRILNIPGKLLGKNEQDKQKALEQQVAKNDTKTPASTESLGEVSYVDEESGFILIRQSAGRKIPASTPLLAKNPTGTITARLLASPRSLWLLDEPMAPLDARHREAFGALMSEHLAAGGLILAAVHDPLPLPTISVAL